MLDTQKVVQIAGDVATANLTNAAVQNVLVEPFTDSEGVQSIRITIVLSPGFPDRIKGDDALNTLVGIQKKLLNEGEERFPLVEYATEEELQESGDT